MASRRTEQHPVNALRSLTATQAYRRHLCRLLGLRTDFDLPPVLSALLDDLDEAEAGHHQ